MANTYSQIYLHVVFAVSERACVILPNRKEELQKFSWQEGFGAFSVSHSHLNAVINYIRKQENHHRRRSFSEEYCEFLERH